jgi:hypothetical protein
VLPRFIHNNYHKYEHLFKIIFYSKGAKSGSSCRENEHEIIFSLFLSLYGGAETKYTFTQTGRSKSGLKELYIYKRALWCRSCKKKHNALDKSPSCSA